MQLHVSLQFELPASFDDHLTVVELGHPDALLDLLKRKRSKKHPELPAFVSLPFGYVKDNHQPAVPAQLTGYEGLKSLPALCGQLGDGVVGDEFLLARMIIGRPQPGFLKTGLLFELVKEAIRAKGQLQIGPGVGHQAL